MKPLHLKIKVALVLSLLLILLIKVINLPRFVNKTDPLSELGFSYHMPKSDFLPKFKPMNNNEPQSNEKSFSEINSLAKTDKTLSNQDKEKQIKDSKKITPKNTQKKAVTKDKKKIKQKQVSKNKQNDPGFSPYAASPGNENSNFNEDSQFNKTNSKTSTANAEIYNQTNTKQNENETESDETRKLSESEWTSLLLNSPQAENLKKFYEALTKKQVSTQFYFNTIIALKESNQINLQNAAIILLNFHISYPSFILISEEISSQNDLFLTYKKNLLEPYSQSLIGVGILIQIVSQENTIPPVTLALTELSNAIDYQITKQENRSGDNSLASLSPSPNGWKRVSNNGNYFPYRNLEQALQQFEKNPNWESSLLTQSLELKEKLQNHVASLSIEKQNTRRTSLLKISE